MTTARVGDPMALLIPGTDVQGGVPLQSAPLDHYESEIHDQGHYARDFERHYAVSAPYFCERFAAFPDVRGKRVLDFGCATGGLLHRLMQAGASYGVGIDLDRGSTDYARERLVQEWGRDKVSILCEDIVGMRIAPVDVVISQNTMEHVSQLKNTMRALVAACKPGGDIYLGFGPLWFSPFGHHQYPRTSIPWLHLLRGDRVVLNALEERTGRRYRDIRAAGFNACTPADFRAAFLADKSVELVSLRCNYGSGGWKRLVSRLLLAPARIPFLEKYLITSMYWHLRKRTEV